MKVILISNYFSHHQEPFSLEMDKLTNHQYIFIATQRIPESRVKSGGFEDINEKYPWILRAYEYERAQTQKVIDDADVVILGDASGELVRNRIKQGKLTFVYSERPLKQKMPFYKYPFRLITWRKKNPHYKKAFLLCASAFTYTDFSKMFLFRNRGFKWGYFPVAKRYEDVLGLIANKKPNSILWGGRLLSWKHPELAVEVAKKLYDSGYNFELNIIGVGEQEKRLHELIEKYRLTNVVHMLGVKTTHELRKYMEDSQIFIFSSDRNEGWGAVLNESMNSACAVVASSAIGSVPFLINDGENGLIFKDRDVDSLFLKVKQLIDNPINREKLSLAGYKTITEEWCAEEAAERLIKLFEALLNKKDKWLFKTGPCSKAEIIKDNWYKG